MPTGTISAPNGPERKAWRVSSHDPSTSRFASLIDCHGIGTAAAATMQAAGAGPGEGPSPRFVTVALEVQYLKPTPLGPALELRATPTTVTDRKVIVEVSVRAEGVETVRGRVVAAPIPASMIAGPGLQSK
jgi:acyl-coenzyme A thioesterase PaaI-like protein